MRTTQYTEADYRQAYLEIKEQNERLHPNTALSEIATAAQISSRAISIARERKRREKEERETKKETE